MAEPFVLQWGEVKRSIEAVQERLANPKPVLREFSKKLTRDIKDNIARGGTGWPPYAASTLKRLESTGTSQVSRRGTVRSDRVKKTKASLERVLKAVQRHGWTDDARKKFDRLNKRIANYEKAERRAKNKPVGSRKIGRRQAEQHQLERHMPGTIRNKLEGNVLTTYSKAGPVGAYQNDGAGKTPARQMIPPPNMEANLDYLAELLESDLGQAWEQGK